MTPAEKIIKALDGKSSGMCNCPCHEDDTASLHVSEGKGGKVLLHCHAGCPQDKLIQYLKDRGLWGSNRRVVPFQPRAMPEEDSSKYKEGQRLRMAYGILLAATYYEQKHPGTARQLLPYLNGRGIDQLPPGALYLPRAEMHHLAERFPEAGLRDYHRDVAGGGRPGKMTFTARCSPFCRAIAAAISKAKKAAKTCARLWDWSKAASYN